MEKFSAIFNISLFLRLAYIQLRNLEEGQMIINLMLIATCLMMSFIYYTREQGKVEISMQSISVVLLSLLYIVLFDYSNSTLIHNSGNGIINAGILIWIVSILWLGRSFGLLPAIRKIKEGGPYSLIRHPIYFSYSLIDLGLLMLYFSAWNAFVLLIGFVSYLIRIEMEESILKTSSRYKSYAMKVKYKLLPFVY